MSTNRNIVVTTRSSSSKATAAAAAARSPLFSSSTSNSDTITNQSNQKKTTTTNTNPPPPTIQRRRRSLMEHFRHRGGSALDTALGISSHVGAAVTAVMELGEDFESIGHGHGMLLLVGSRLAREMNLLRSAVVEEVEELITTTKLQSGGGGGGGDVSTTTTSARSGWTKWILYALEPFFVMGRLLSTKLFASVLAVAALTAAAMEVLEDSRPGGHHGAVLLAINELWELLELSNLVPRKWHFIVGRQHVLRLALVSGALIVAVMEMIQEHKVVVHEIGKKAAAGAGVGGHHGVALFALAKMLRVIALMRTQVKELSAVEEEIEGGEGESNNENNEKKKKKEQ